MTVPKKGGGPRLDHVPTVIDICPVHGETEFRIHKVGKDHKGEQKYRKRCPKCHTGNFEK